MSSEPDCPLLRQISAAGQSSWAFCDGFYAGVAVQHSGTLGGYLVATRAFSRLGEVIIDEQPLLEADTNGGDDWAEPLFRVFCAAPAERQADVLKMYSGKGNVNQGVRLRNDISVQVQRCVGKPWRRGVSDETLTAVCLVFSLNAYPSQAQDSCNALFPLGAMLAHSCEANVRYSWAARERASGKDPVLFPVRGPGDRQCGSGRFVAKRDICEGEILYMNYLGDLGQYMSTPARRELLLDTKLFECHCSRCADLGEDLHRRIPCARCHPRGSDGLLPRPIAFPRNEGRVLSDGSTFQIHYVAPSRAALGADAVHTWGPCSGCGATCGDDAVLPSGSGIGDRLCGRASEQQVEKYVQGLLAQLATIRGTGGEQVRLGVGDLLAQKIQTLEALVARRVGAMHWASMRMRALMQQYGVASGGARRT